MAVLAPARPCHNHLGGEAKECELALSKVHSPCLKTWALLA